ncbi:hypothetical protein CTI14_02315 [Methylobacterium radiotolerans]|nr:hypothetical protein CTI14_02315 [Methylobacterium radiotolerans]
MTSQQARTVGILQWIVTILMALDVFGDYNVPEWDARNDGVFIVLLCGSMLITAYRARLETGRWPGFVLAMAALALVAAVVVRWF